MCLKNWNLYCCLGLWFDVDMLFFGVIDFGCCMMCFICDE